MKLRNDTAYPNAELRALLVLLTSDEHRPAALDRTKLKVRIRLLRRGKYTRFSYATHSLEFKVVRGKLDMVKLAARVRCGLYLTSGYRVRDLPPKVRAYEAEGLKEILEQANVPAFIEEQQEPAPSLTDRRAKAYARLCKREVSWETKLKRQIKRAENALKKIRAAKKRYEKMTEVIETEEARKRRLEELKQKREQKKLEEAQRAAAAAEAKRLRHRWDL